MDYDINGPFIVAYTIHLPDRFWYVRISYADDNPQKTAFEETMWASVTPGIVFVDSAIKPDGTILTETEFHNYLREKGFIELSTKKHSTGWFLCEKSDIVDAYNNLMNTPSL